jgi:hypothetical protein
MNDLEFVGDYRQPQLSARQRALGHDGTSAGEFTFGDFLDIINPLQHIPIISTLYRELTGDEISPHARIMGDTLFGGPMGFVSSIAGVLYEEVAGEDPGETVLAFFTGEDAEGEPQFAGDDGEVVPAAAFEAPLETAAGPDADANAAAILPEAAPGMLTGQDALNALFLDLGGGRPSAAAAVAPPPAAEAQVPAQVQGEAAKSYPLPPRHVRVGPAAPPPAPPAAAAAETNALLFAQEAGEAAIADRMMQALDKYQAMSQQSRRGDDREDPEDKSERVKWQSDPAAGNGT